MLRRRLAVPAAAVLFAVAGCDQPSGPTPDRPRLGRSAGPVTGTIVGIDLGVLPGDVESEATVVTEDGIVYGLSYDDQSHATHRYFRWTATTGMQEVSSIPASGSYPFPTITPPPGSAVDVRWANAKGEATGQLCSGSTVCDEVYAPAFNGHVFRWSQGAGLRDLEPPLDNPADDPNRSIGLAINRWGHVAGNRIEPHLTDSENFFWAPVDTFVTLAGPGVGSQDPVLLNDNDQVVWTRQNFAADRDAFVWRPDLGVRELVSPSCSSYQGALGLNQQNVGSDVVGWAWVTGEDGNCWKRAVLWHVPAVNRAAYPSVDANPISSASTISIAKTGGRYFQFYQATQSTASGPYVELVDWGDGATSSLTRTNIGATAWQSHVYAQTGTYWVRVYVKDQLGRWGVAERKVTVIP